MTDVNEQIPSYSFSFLHAFFFLGVELCYFFFPFLFTPCFFFFFLLFGVRHLSFFILIGVAFVLLVFGLFFGGGVELCCFFFFFSFHAFLFFFFFWGCAVFLLFSVLDIFLFLSGGCRICSSCFWSLFLVSYFLGPCVFSLSASIAWTSRSEIDSSLFLAASLIVFVEPW